MRQEIDKALEFFIQGKTVLYPTDTVWGLGCDATNAEAVQKIYKIKNREESKSLIVLVSHLEMLKTYIEKVPEQAILFLESQTKPTTIIYKNPRLLASNAIADDHTVGIRIVQNEFCQKLIQQFGKPIISTSANLSGSPTPMCFDEISPSVLDQVDYVVDLHRSSRSSQSSQIIKFNAAGHPEYLRK